MLKNDLRLKYSELRKDVSPHSLLNSSLSIATKVLELPIWDFNYYHIFMPIKDKVEVDTSFIISILKGKVKNILIPKVIGKNALKHYALTAETKLERSAWGVPEPKEGTEVDPQKIDVVFLPLLAFDQHGNRVGYGKGFYDTFLSKCRTDIIKVGLSLFKPENNISDISEDDIPLDYCVTPEVTYSFSTI